MQKRLFFPSRMLSSGLLVCALAFTSVSTAHTREARGPTADDRITLGATNVISGSRSAFERVRLTSEAQISLVLQHRRAAGPTSDIDIAKDQSAAILLIDDPLLRGLGSSEGYLLAGRLPRCVDAGCSPRDRWINYRFPLPSPGDKPRLVIPAGDYRIYLITEEPVTVTLRLQGPSGKTAISPTSPASVDLKSPPEHPASAPLDSFYTAGDTYRAGQKGIVLTTLFASTPDKSSFQYGLCGYGGPAAPPPAVAYGPHCTALSLAGLGAASIGAHNNTRSFLKVLLSDYTERSFPPSLTGEQGFGGWISASAGMTSAGSHTYFLVLDD